MCFRIIEIKQSPEGQPTGLMCHYGRLQSRIRRGLLQKRQDLSPISRTLRAGDSVNFTQNSYVRPSQIVSWSLFLIFLGKLLAAGNKGPGTGSHELHPDADQEKADEFAENGHTRRTHAGSAVFA